MAKLDSNWDLKGYKLLIKEFTLQKLGTKYS